jgi:hypothetical protein
MALTAVPISGSQLTAMQEKQKLIYIMGCANCGSTLLTTLLARHSQITTVGELKLTAITDIDSYLCGCGQRLLDCEFWRSVQKRCRERGVELDPVRFRTHFEGTGWLNHKLIHSSVRPAWMERLRSLGLVMNPSARNELNRVLQRNLTIMQAICEEENKPVFLDGSKDPVRLLHFARSGLFDIRAIHLVRDGRAIVASYKKRSPDTSGNIELWKTKAIECERVRSLISASHIHTLRYEDLCADVSGNLKSLFRFIDVPDESQACQEDAPGSSRHIIGHNSRLSSTCEIRVRQEWQNILTESELKLFGSREGSLNERYHYKGPPSCDFESAPSPRVGQEPA